MTLYAKMSVIRYTPEEYIKLYDLSSGYLGEMPIAKVKLYEGDKWRPVYSAECLLNDIEKEGEFRVVRVDKEKSDYAETHEDLIL